MRRALPSSNSLETPVVAPSFCIASARLLTPNTHIRCSGGTESDGTVPLSKSSKRRFQVS